MAEAEKFDFKKFLSGFVNPVTHAKNLQFLVWFALIILIGFTIWRAFFMHTQAQSQKQTATVIALPGSTVTYAPEQSQKQEVKKRPWWLPIPFVEGYGFVESDNRKGVGAKAGARIDF